MTSRDRYRLQTLFRNKVKITGIIVFVVVRLFDLFRVAMGTWDRFRGRRPGGLVVDEGLRLPTPTSGTQRQCRWCRRANYEIAARLRAAATRGDRDGASREPPADFASGAARRGGLVEEGLHRLFGCRFYDE